MIGRKGTHPARFFEGTSGVAPATFGYPFSLKLIRWLEGRVEKSLEEVAKESAKES